MTSHTYDTDVLIVGAGPTGLALGNALARLGTRFMLIEAKAETSIHTKATNLMPGTLEQLDVWGLAAPMYSEGGVMERYMVHMYGTNVGPRAMRSSDSPHPHVLFLGQDRIDRALKDALPESGAEIRFSHRLTALSQDEDGVNAVVEAGAETTAIRARYVVGCDGPRSTVRRRSACDFEPVRTGKYVWQVDAKLSWRGLATMKQMWLYYYAEGFGAVIHLPGGLTKVMAFEEKGRLPAREPTLEEMQAKLRMMSGDETATLADPVWVSHGELLTGVAPSFIDRRIVLAGDASNPILPNGGQGLNVGIQDALNLAWKLHDIVRGAGTSALLESYEAERRANRLALETVQINTLKNTLPAPALNRWFFRRYGKVFLDRFWPLLAKAFSQLGVSYAKGPLTLERMGRKGAGAGHRVLDADLLRLADGAEVSLFAELCAPRWKLVTFDDGRTDTVLPAVGRVGTEVDRLHISALQGTLRPAANVSQYADVERLAHGAYGVTRPMVLLIRPDNYIAARVPLEELGEIEHFLARFYGAIGVPAADRLHSSANNDPFRA